MELTGASLPQSQASFEPRTSGEPLPTARERPSLLRDPEGLFTRHFERHSFLFEHGLGEHSQFQLAQLLNLAQRHPKTPGWTYWSDHIGKVGDKWQEGQGNVCGALAGIAAGNSFVQFCYVDQDPVIGPPIRELMAAVISVSGKRLREDLIRSNATLMIASPRRITHYHCDSPAGFMIQIAGSGKTLGVFERDDRESVPEDELERFYSGDFNSVKFKKHLRHRASEYVVRGGQGVHIPCVSPHWAENGPDVSVALSLSFHLRSDERRSRIYQLNRRLRRLGLQPTPPGVSPWRDRLKLATKDSLAALRGGHTELRQGY